MKRFPSLRSVLSILALAAVAVFAAAARAPEDAQAALALPRPKTIVLVRHAEKDPAGDARDPGLSAEGKARAERLAKLFGAAGVTHLHATEFHRTQDTLAPLAALAKKEVVVTPGAKTAELLKALDALPGGAIAVVAGHSNTVPAIAAHFGVTLAGTEKTAQGVMLPESSFDRVFVITLPPRESKASWSLLELRY
jgi:hypothetical protein